MNYLKPTGEGYYWYRHSEAWDDLWDIVKVQFYSQGYKKNSRLKLRKPVLMFQLFGWLNLDDVKKSKGIWGRKVASLREGT